MVLKMKPSLKIISILIYCLSFCLPVFRNETVPGLVIFAVGFINLFTDLSFSVWLANIFYLLSLLSSYRHKSIGLVFSAAAVLLAMLFPFVFWGEVIEDDRYVNDLGPGYWMWLAAFAISLVDSVNGRKRISSGKQDLVT